MAQFPDSGFARRPLSRLAKVLSLLGLTSVLATASLAHAQASSPPANEYVRKDKPAISTVSPATPEPVDPHPPLAALPQPLTAEQTPPQPPVVTWDGALLVIDAENSTLADIFAEVGTRTGASMEIPPSVGRERVFVHLGPGSVRDVISSLLYGTGFDYIVEASEDDPDTLSRVVLTARGKEDDSAVGSVADASGAEPATTGAGANGLRGSIAQGVPYRDGMRMMRGWAAPGKPAFQANAETALAAEEALKSSAEATDTADANTQNPTAARTDSSATGVDTSNMDAHSSSAAAISPGNSSSVSGADTPLATASAASSSESGSDSNDPTGVSGMIQNMTHMFEQRRQIQAKQNQAEQQQQSPD